MMVLMANVKKDVVEVKLVSCLLCSGVDRFNSFGFFSRRRDFVHDNRDGIWSIQFDRCSPSIEKGFVRSRITGEDRKYLWGKSSV